MATTTPIPVILCGKTERIGEGVIRELQPEYEVIEFIMTPEAGITNIPLLLSGSAPASSLSQLGSKNFSRLPGAIILGAGYDDEAAERMRKAVAEAEAVGTKVKKVPWLRPDTSKPAPPLGPEYGKALVVRIKELMADLQKQGKLDGGEDGVYWY